MYHTLARSATFASLIIVAAALTLSVPKGDIAICHFSPGSYHADGEAFTTQRNSRG
jgi:hypothetical protein